MPEAASTAIALAFKPEQSASEFVILRQVVCNTIVRVLRTHPDMTLGLGRMSGMSGIQRTGSEPDEFRLPIDVDVDMRTATAAEVAMDRRRGVVSRQQVGTLVQPELRTLHGGIGAEHGRMCLVAHRTVAMVLLPARRMNAVADTTTLARSVRDGFSHFEIPSAVAR